MRLKRQYFITGYVSVELNGVVLADSKKEAKEKWRQYLKINGKGFYGEPIIMSVEKVTDFIFDDEDFYTDSDLVENRAD